jgi:glutathione S-transferase
LVNRATTAPQAQVNQWADASAAIEAASYAWIEPFCHTTAADNAAREAAKATIEAQLQALEAHLAGSKFLAGSSISLADALLVPTTLPLFQAVLSQEARKAYASVERWLLECAQEANFAKVLGEWRAAWLLASRVAT